MKPQSSFPLGLLRDRKVAFQGLFPFLLLALALAKPGVGRAAPSLQGLGDLPGGSFSSVPSGISADGITVVGNSISSDSPTGEPFVWSLAGGIKTIDKNHQPGMAWGCNSNGATIVGGSSVSGTMRMFRWTSAGLVILPMPAPSASWLEAQAFACSRNGAVVCGEGTSGRAKYPLIWTNNVTIALTNLPPSNPNLVNHGYARGISADGSVVVGYSRGEAFRWTSVGGMVALGHLAPPVPNHPTKLPETVAYAVSGDGQVVVGYSAMYDGTNFLGREPFRWTDAGGMQSLGHIGIYFDGKYEAIARAVSDDGTVVVGTTRTGPNDVDARAFVWREGMGMRLLVDILVESGVSTNGWRALTEGWGISADGRKVIGVGLHADLSKEAFVAELPEPVVLKPSVSAGGSHLILTWPGWASDWHLLSTTNVAHSNSWTTNLVSVAVSNDTAYATVPLPGAGQEFYRVRKP